MASPKTIASIAHCAEPQNARNRMFEILECSPAEDRTGRAVDIAIIVLILASVAAVVLESIDSLHLEYLGLFHWFEVFTVGAFTIEYLLRLWSCVEQAPAAKSAASRFAFRLRYAFSFHAIVDLLAILPFYLLLAGIAGGVDMRFLRTFRLLRILKLTRYSSALNLLFATIAENGRSLAASFFILMTIMFMASSGIYYFERVAQPIDFGSIPASMWWAFATLTTVGYGDVTPITAGGRIFGAMITVVGVGMVALPAGILASGFAHQLRMRVDEYKTKADEALDDGVLTDTEINDLEQLRAELGLGSHTASQILDTEKVRRALRRHGAGTCPHCGAPLNTDAS
jgi:voltage-gated potassium channel